jgi:hypothetical protein
MKTPVHLLDDRLDGVFDAVTAGLVHSGRAAARAVSRERQNLLAYRDRVRIVAGILRSL